MHRNHRRLARVEERTIARQRSTLAGLVALLEARMLRVEELSDAELELVIKGDPGDPPIGHLSDQELAAIIRGDRAR